MSLLLVALVVGLASGSEREIELRPATFLSSDTTLDVELSYQIPYTSLTFVRQDSDFQARYQLRFQCWDARRILVRAQDWEERLQVKDYDATMRPGATITGSRTLTVPRQKLQAEAVIQDLQSERNQALEFEVKSPGRLSELELTRTTTPGGTEGSEQAGTLRDTLLVDVELYQTGKSEIGSESGQVAKWPSDRVASHDHLIPGPHDHSEAVETLSVRIMNGQRARAGERVGVIQDSWRVHRRFVFPLQDYENGDFEVQAQALDRTGKVVAESRATFQVAGSFFNSERSYREHVDELLWIASEEQMRKLRAARPGERESLWRAFWNAKDQTPSSMQNESEQAYFERIAYSVEHFSHGDRGLRSDRAMVYVKLGPPDNVETAPFETESYASETWHYYSLNRSFVFYDVGGFGEYKLTDAAAREFLHQ